MKLENFKLAKEIEYDREKLRTAIEQLERGVNITIHGTNGSGSYNFATIGTGDNCEHPDTALAAALIAQMIQRRYRALTALNAKFDAL